ncbi:MAG TPA: PIN domain-containing protein [Thermoanaerobaculia bacterium]|nr:PIN domain-containing protein [Thermoanaerobaculia bacterium]
MKQSSPAFLDTSFVVRYLTNDPAEMAAQAGAVIDSDEQLVLSELVLLETAYVLTSVYRVPRSDVVDALLDLIQRSNLRLLNLSKPRALSALSLCRDSNRCSFADALLWAEALESGAERLYSFDRKFPARGLDIVGQRSNQ